MASTFNPSSHSLCPPKPYIHFSHFTCHLRIPQTAPQTLTPDPKLVITGGAILSGHVAISGSKNSALSILAATLCCSGTSKIRNVPNLLDTRTMASILGSLGADIDAFDGGMSVNTDGVRSIEPCSDKIGRLRGGFFVIGPLLARFGEAVVALPGGCVIGARPVDLYIRGLRALGAIVELRDGKVQACAANGKGLVGGRFRLDYPSVGATETLMMAACMADGVTMLSNVAQEPEVIDLARFLTNCGACVEGAGTDKLYIKGRTQLHGSEYDIIPDRIEAGTFMLAAAITRSCISMSPVFPGHLSCFIDKLVATGCRFTQLTCDKLQISAVPENTGDDLRGFDIKTSPFPGFPTDLQPQTVALLTACNGSSLVEESVFENRMGHAFEVVRELQKFGPRIQVCGSTALVFGKEKGRPLYGSRVFAPDLRGGVSLVLAGLAAEGITKISGINHIDRGYENLEIKLQLLGADVTRLCPIASPL